MKKCKKCKIKQKTRQMFILDLCIKCYKKNIYKLKD